jgi:hypothetical protein
MSWFVVAALGALVSAASFVAAVAWPVSHAGADPLRLRHGRQRPPAAASGW